MKVVIIVQARMTSTRLPGKVLKEVLGKPLLEYQVERLRRVLQADEIVIATTENETDQPIVDFCNNSHLPVFRGSENDVLSRYYHAATKFNADAIVRITSDCPIIDPIVVNRVIEFFKGNLPQVDYVSNFIDRKYPRGMDTEIFSYKVLKQAFFNATALPDREHVTPFIYRNPQQFKIAGIANDKDESINRWTVDTPEDFQLIKNIIEELYPVKEQFTMEDVLNLLEKHPDWKEINAHIEQKLYGQ